MGIYAGKNINELYELLDEEDKTATELEDEIKDFEYEKEMVEDRLYECRERIEEIQDKINNFDVLDRKVPPRTDDNTLFQYIN